MAKINLVNEVLKHTDEEIIDYLYGISAAIYRDYTKVEDPTQLLKLNGQVVQLYSVLKGLKERNDSRKDSNVL